MTGPGIIYSQASASKNFRFKERWNLQFRFDFQNPFHNYGFSNPSNQVDFKNPQLFGKITRRSDYGFLRWRAAHELRCCG